MATDAGRLGAALVVRARSRLCAVPLGDTAWKAAREKFETAMKAASKEFGEAPPK